LWTLASNTVFLHSRRSEAIAWLIFSPFLNPPFRLWIRLWCFLNKLAFLRDWDVTPIPNLGDQGVSLCLDPHSWPLRARRPCQ
jgi:hypothetical protein